MDREISKKEQSKSKFWTGLKAGFILLLLVACLIMFRSFLSTSAPMTEFHIAEIERGNIQNSLTASGIVVPSFERELNAPVNTEIKKVILSKGALVAKGDLILILDQEFTKLEYQKLNDELSLQRNKVDKLKLRFDKDLRDLDYKDQIKALEIEQFENEVRDQEHLLSIGGGTQEELEQVRLDLQVAKIQKKMLENDLQFTQSTNGTNKQDLELEYGIQEKRLQELQRKLKETSVAAPLDGVITWINEDIGKTVVQGEPLVRIANLQHYKIEATSSDRHAEQVVVGMPVLLRINKKELKGSIETVLPELENNSVKFVVSLEQPNAAILRPNIRVEVFMITNSKQNILRVKNGPALAGASQQDVFMLQNGQAVKASITKGLSNVDYVEVLGGGLSAGQRIIISKTDDYDHLERFTIK